MTRPSDQPDPLEATHDQPATAEHLPPPAAEGPGTRIGPYKLLEVIGEGGMGVVWMAEQQEPIRRLVAVKVIKEELNFSRAGARFEAERQALALMDHPNIARVFDAGTTEAGRPYFVMELVKGVPITQFCDERKLTPRERLELFVPVCEAVQHAHQKGVIHRDLKPSNILIALYDGRPVPKVIDFGIAKTTGQRLTEKTLFTAFGTVVGTVEYMSPEQAELNQLDIDTRSDVYSLGVLLYELLTGSTPLDRARQATAVLLELLRQVREVDPPRPSDRLSGSDTLPAISARCGTEPAKLPGLVRGELDWIVMKALEKDRTRRYETANGLGRDVRRYLADEPVEACPPSVAYRWWKFARKHRPALLAAGAFAALLVFGAAVAAWLAVRAMDAEGQAAQERDDARESERVARQARDDLRRALYAARSNLIQAAWNADNVGRALQLLDEQRPRPGETDLRGFEWHYMNRQCRSELRTLRLDHLKFASYKGQAFSYYNPSLSPDGSRLAVVDRDPKENRGHRILVYELARGREVYRTNGLPPWDGVEVAGWCRDGKRLLARVGSGNGDRGGLIVIDSETEAVRPLLEAPRHGIGLTAFSPDGRQVATADDKETDGSPGLSLRVWDADSGKERFVVALKGSCGALSYGADGTLLHGLVFPPANALDPPGRAAARRGVRVSWDAKGNEVSKVEGFPVSHGFVFSPDGKSLARHGETDRNIELWEAATGLRLLAWPVPNEIEGRLVFSPDSKMLALRPFQQGAIRVWQTTALPGVAIPGRGTVSPPVYTFKGFTFEVAAVAFGAASDQLIALGDDGVVKVWEAGKPIHGPVFIAHWELPERVPAPPAGPAPGRADVTLVLRDREGKEHFRIPELGHAQVEVSPDRRFIVTVQKALKVWDAASAKVLFEQKLRGGEPPEMFSFRFSPDGRQFYAWRVGEPVRGWDTSDFKERLSIPTLDHPLDQVVLDPTARRIALRRAVLPSGKPLHANRHLADGNVLLELWDTRENRRLFAVSGPASRSSGGLVFSPDGSKVGAVLDGRIRVWDTEIGTELPSEGTAGDERWCGPDNTGRRVVVHWDGQADFDLFGEDPARIPPLPDTFEASIRDVRSGRVLRHFRGHAHPLQGAAFNPKGTRLATISTSPGSDRGGEVRLWDADTGAELLALPVSDPPVEVWFSPDGHTLRVKSGQLPITEFSWDGRPLAVDPVQKAGRP